MTDTDALLGRAWHDDTSWELLTRLTELPERMGGHPGERRAAGHVRESFEESGIAGVEIEEFEMWRWDRGGAELAVTDPIERSFETLALPYSAAGEVSGELIDVGYGTPEEVEERDVTELHPQGVQGQGPALVDAVVEHQLRAGVGEQQVLVEAGQLGVVVAGPLVGGVAA